MAGSETPYLSWFGIEEAVDRVSPWSVLRPEDRVCLQVSGDPDQESGCAPLLPPPVHLTAHHAGWHHGEYDFVFLCLSHSLPELSVINLFELETIMSFLPQRQCLSWPFFLKSESTLLISFFVEFPMSSTKNTSVADYTGAAPWSPSAMWFYSHWHQEAESISLLFNSGTFLRFALAKKKKEKKKTIPKICSRIKVKLFQA